jgi:phenylpyruvate tautomerase PptA (4-oxalocrotonate tautomerase family)
MSRWAAVSAPTAGVSPGEIKAPAAPAAPKVTAGGPTAAEKAALDKRIAAAAAAQPVTETIRQVMKMLEAVRTKQDAQFIKDYINTQFGSNLTETAKAQRNKLIEHVTKVTAVRRRQFAKAN